MINFQRYLIKERIRLKIKEKESVDSNCKIWNLILGLVYFALPNLGNTKPPVLRWRVSGILVPLQVELSASDP